MKSAEIKDISIKDLQERIENAVMRTKQGNFLALSSAVKQDIGEQVRAIVQAAQAAGPGEPTKGV